MRPELPEGYRASYKHELDYVGERHGKPVRGRTVAYIKLKEDNTVVATGYAYCSASDQYDRRIGRLISLGRALQELSAKVNT